MVPNSMEGMSGFSDNTLNLTPYEVHGTVTSYDETTGTGTLTIADGDWIGPAGESFDDWNVEHFCRSQELVLAAAQFY